MILRGPGTNCDEESAFAFERAGSVVSSIHINRFLAAPQTLVQFQILCLPGGFSYGDDIAAGKILAGQLQNQLPAAIAEFREKGNLILGICNGFQVLLKSGFLLEEHKGCKENDCRSSATLTWNDSGCYIDNWVHLAVHGRKCVFLRDVRSMYLPIAHAEGKFVPCCVEYLKRLDEDGQLALKYCPPENATNGGNDTADNSGSSRIPFNPNGSIGHVAGVCDASGRIFGLMPHPERHIDPTHHPQWTRKGPAAEGPAAAGDGLSIFTNAVQYFS
jgi:phosphoribosylformylglycinamidine synthase